jgi:predicted nucleic acid-binding protein
MIVVSDTTPLRHSIAIGEAELLPRLYGVVVVPDAVSAELQAEATPLTVKTWVANAPDWLEVRSSRTSVPYDLSTFWMPESGKQSNSRQN